MISIFDLCEFLEEFDLLRFLISLSSELLTYCDLNISEAILSVSVKFSIVSLTFIPFKKGLL